jgi:hypothetical protein
VTKLTYVPRNLVKIKEYVIRRKTYFLVNVVVVGQEAHVKRKHRATTILATYMGNALQYLIKYIVVVILVGKAYDVTEQ